MPTRLTDEQIATALLALPAWRYDAPRAALHRRIVLADFAAAFGLMTSIAIAAEKADHHPEWSNVYNRIDIWLTTHDVAGLSARDIALARHIDALSAARPAAE